jgi:hypothetical protein
VAGINPGVKNEQDSQMDRPQRRRRSQTPLGGRRYRLAPDQRRAL